MEAQARLGCCRTREQGIDSASLIDLYNRTHEATNALRAQAAEILEFTKRLEELTKDTLAWHVGTRARVEARTALEQAEKLGRVLQDLGKRLGE